MMFSRGYRTPCVVVIQRPSFPISVLRILFCSEFSFLMMLICATDTTGSVRGRRLPFYFHSPQTFQHYLRLIYSTLVLLCRTALLFFSQKRVAPNTGELEKLMGPHWWRS